MGAWKLVYITFVIKIHPIACHTSVLVYMKIHSVTSYISQVEVQIPEIKRDEYMAGVQVCGYTDKLSCISLLGFVFTDAKASFQVLKHYWFLVVGATL